MTMITNHLTARLRISGTVPLLLHMPSERYTQSFLKIKAIWDVTLLSMVDGYQCFRGECCLIFYLHKELVDSSKMLLITRSHGVTSHLHCFEKLKFHRLFRHICTIAKNTYQLRHIRLSVHPPVSTGSHWIDFHEIW